MRGDRTLYSAEVWPLLQGVCTKARLWNWKFIDKIFASVSFTESLGKDLVVHAVSTTTTSLAVHTGSNTTTHQSEVMYRLSAEVWPLFQGECTQARLWELRIHWQSVLLSLEYISKRIQSVLFFTSSEIFASVSLPIISYHCVIVTSHAQSFPTSPLL